MPLVALSLLHGCLLHQQNHGYRLWLQPVLQKIDCHCNLLMEAVWIEYIPWVYASIQGLITLVISIVGVKFVRNEFLLQKSSVKQHVELTVNVDTEIETVKEANQQKQIEIEPIEPSRDKSEQFEVCDCQIYVCDS